MIEDLKNDLQSVIVPQIRLGQSFHLTVFNMKVHTWAGPGNTGTLPVRRPTPPSLRTSSLFDRWCRAKINRGCVEERYRWIRRDIGCLRHKTSLMTQRVYSITLRMGRDRIKLAGVPEFPTSRSRLRTRAPTDKTWRDWAFPSVFSGHQQPKPSWWHMFFLYYFCAFWLRGRYVWRVASARPFQNPLRV